MAKFAIGRSVRGNMFSLCVKAAILKAFEYAVFAHTKKGEDGAFFHVATLRGICEDVIVFGFIRSLPRSDRDQLLAGLLRHDVLTNVGTQARFFAAARPYQPVLKPPANAASQVQAVEAEIRAVWARHGWNLNRGTMPQTRQIAERLGQPALAALYEYMYRLTSGMVHFNTSMLLRSGWGDSRAAMSFSPKHFDRYYVLFARTYSTYLLCLHAELLRRFIRPSRSTSALLHELRDSLRHEARWPEMVTFEEMNLTPPDPGVLAQVARIAQAVMSRRKSLLA